MKLIVSSSPHIRSGETTQKLMFHVILALLPALAVGVWQFGLRALALTAVTVAASLLAEWVYRMATRQGNTLPDGSAAVTGLLLAMTLPASVPYWVGAVGAVFAIVVVKGVMGGLGQNLFNPALAARAFLMLLWPVHLTRFPDPSVPMGLTDGPLDAMTAATPLHHMQIPALPEVNLLDLFLGRGIGGCIGEISALAILLGGAWLLCRKVISWRIPAGYLGTMAALTLVFSKGQDPVQWMLYSLLGGGVMLAAFFMATDYATSPVSPRGQLVYGAGCGLLNVLFRYYGLFPEGVTYAILLMNATAWGLDRLLAPSRFGGQKGVSRA